jgi:hypothetical protein
VDKKYGHNKTYFLKTFLKKETTVLKVKKKKPKEL